MVQISRFWDGTTLGDATVAPYDAGTEFSEVMSAIAGASATPDKGGVIRSTVGELAISSPSAGTVRVGIGEAMVYGAWYKSDTNVDHTFPTPAAAARTDRIVLRKSWSTQTVRQMVVTGAEGGSVPTLTQVVGDTWDVPIAQVAVATNGTITITDQRVTLGVPDVSVILTDPIVRDTLWFGAKPAGIADAQIKRMSAGSIAAPNEIFTVGILQADGPLAQERAFKTLTNGVMRWFWGIAGGSTEAGGNSGSDQGLYRYADDGSFLGAVTGYRRSDGLITHHTFTQFLNSTQWGTNGQRVAQEGGNLVWRRASDSAGTLVLGDNGNLSTMADIGAGGAIFANAGYVYAGSAAGNYLRMGYNGELFANNGQSITVNPSSAYFHPVNGTVRNGHPSVPWYDVFTAHVSCTGEGVFDGGVRANAGNLNLIATSNNISLAPAAGYVHPDGNNTRSLGHPSIAWNNVFSYIFTSPGNHTIQATGAIYFSPYSGANILIIENSPDGFYPGTATLVVNCGRSDRRWWNVYCGQINTSCTQDVKEDIVDLVPNDVLNDLLKTPIVSFKYKRPGVPPDMTDTTAAEPDQIGIIAERTPTRFLTSHDSANPMAIASAAVAGVQALYDKIAELQRDIADLKEKVA